MDDAKRRVAVTKRVSLSDIGDGWDECYATVRLATFDELGEIAEKSFADVKYLDVIKFEMDLVKEHFIDGKILILDESGKPVLQDMVANDVKSYPQIADHLYATIIGVDLNPKDTRTEVPSKTESTNDSNTTKTS